jgi:hypothetical protein
MNFQQVNWLMDTVMPQVDGATFKVIGIVARKTWGWNKASDMISIGQFMTLTGTKNRTNMTRAIQSALDSGFISRQESGNGFSYSPAFASTESVLPSTESVLAKGANSTESVPLASTESVPTTIKEKEIIITGDPIELLAAHFTTISGRMPTNGHFAEDWQKPLELILSSYGENTDKAKEAISQAITFTRTNKPKGGGSYRISNPRSIVNIVANLKDSEQPKDKVRIKAI